MTAEEFIKDAQQNPEKGWTAKKMLIEFAKYHVKKALNKIYEEAKHGDEEHQQWLKEFFDNYPLDNIK